MILKRIASAVWRGDLKSGRGNLSTESGTLKKAQTTSATITMEKTDAGFTVTQSHLDVTAHVPGQNRERVLAMANDAQANCPISRLLNAAITMDARIET